MKVAGKLVLAIGSLSFCWGSTVIGRETALQPVQASLYSPARASDQHGTVEGVVSFLGEVPKSPVPDDAGAQRPLLEVDRETRGLRYVVAHLVPMDPADRASPAGAASPSDQPVTVDQLNYEFIPRVVAVRAGQPVNFTNSEAANHNVRTATPDARNSFNIFTGAGASYQRRFQAEPNLRPIRLDCDLHPWMRGWVYVFEDGYFAVTDQKGRFQMDAVPPGRYRLVLRHPDLRYSAEREVTVSAAEATRIEVEVQPPGAKAWGASPENKRACAPTAVGG